MNQPSPEPPGAISRGSERSRPDFTAAVPALTAGACPLPSETPPAAAAHAEGTQADTAPIPSPSCTAHTRLHQPKHLPTCFFRSRFYYLLSKTGQILQRLLLLDPLEPALLLPAPACKITRPRLFRCSLCISC